MIKLEAGNCQALQKDSTFCAIIAKVRQDQVNLFSTSAKADIEVREEAHAILRALNKIEQALESVITDEAMRNRKHKKGSTS